MKIEKGQKYLCVGNAYNHNFKKGKIYVSTHDYVLISYDGSEISFGEFQECFQPLSSAKWAIKRTPENAEVVNRWANQNLTTGNVNNNFYLLNDFGVSSHVKDGYTEIDFETFKEITGMGEERESLKFNDGDRVLIISCCSKAKWYSNQIGQVFTLDGQYDENRWKLKENQNFVHKYDIQKIFTIEDVRNGKCAIENDGTVEELATVINKSFPSQTKFEIGFHYDKDKYYGILDHEAEWTCVSETLIPSQSVKLFLSQIEGEKEQPIEEWQPKWGEEVEVSYEGGAWVNKIFVGINPIDCDFKYIAINRGGKRMQAYKQIRQPIHEFTTEQAKQDLAKLHNLNVNQIKITD